MNDLWSGSGKSRQGEMAVLCHEREPWAMKTNQDRGDCEPFSVWYSADDKVDWTDQEPELARARRIPVTEATASRGSFPLRTLIVCFTIWLIATQAMIFDQIKFDEHAHLLERAARPFGGPEVVIPSERPSNLPSGAKVQRL